MEKFHETFYTFKRIKNKVSIEIFRSLSLEVYELELYIFLAIFSLYVLISLLILPFQYRFLVALKAEEKKNKSKGIHQGEMYDSKNAGELSLHGNMQGNPLFFLANIMASVIYKIKHPKDTL